MLYTGNSVAYLLCILGSNELAFSIAKNHILRCTLIGMIVLEVQKD